jgi:DNA-binding response OmpR family regulator
LFSGKSEWKVASASANANHSTTFIAGGPAEGGSQPLRRCISCQGREQPSPIHPSGEPFGPRLSHSSPIASSQSCRVLASHRNRFKLDPYGGRHTFTKSVRRAILREPQVALGSLFAPATISSQGSRAPRKGAKRIRILLLDDERSFRGEVEAALAESGFEYRLESVADLAPALERLESGSVDIALLCLAAGGAGGEQGLATLAACLAHAADVPVIVITSAADELLALRAVRAGAQDHLIRGQLYGTMLARTLRFAIERHQLRVQDERRRERLEADLRALQAVLSSPPTEVTARAYGSLPLSQAAPAEFEDLVERYSRLLEVALDRRIYKVEDDLSASMRVMADRLGFLQAGPRDVVAIHSATVERKTGHTTAERRAAYLDEARLTVLGLMGHLVSYYRRHALGSGGRQPDPATMAEGMDR